MKLVGLVLAALVILVGLFPVYAVTLTFDDIPSGADPYLYYRDLYGVGVNMFVVNHAGSAWGPPHSGNSVAVWTLEWDGPGMIINGKHEHPPIPSSFARTVGAYFSTEPGYVLQMIGYHSAIYEDPVASVTIGAAGEQWNNIYVQIDSSAGIGFVEFKSVTPYAVMHFSMDDLNVEFVPEPASLLALGVGLAGLALRRRR